MLTKAPRGTKDITPKDAYKWSYLENKFREVCSLFGYEEIRTPIFEHTELFQRGVGETTDVVQKEMYTFEDKGKRSITLKRSEEHTSELQSRQYLVCRLLLEKKKKLHDSYF